MKKATDTDYKGRIEGYRTAVKTGEVYRQVIDIVGEIEQSPIGEHIAELFDVCESLLVSENPVECENLLDSINSSLDELWNCVNTVKKNSLNF